MPDATAEPIAPDDALALADGDSERLRELLPGVVAHMSLLADEAARDKGLEVADRLFEILEHTSDDKIRRDILRRHAISSEILLRQLALFLSVPLPMDPEAAELLAGYAVGAL